MDHSSWFYSFLQAAGTSWLWCFTSHFTSLQDVLLRPLSRALQTSMAPLQTTAAVTQFFFCSNKTCSSWKIIELSESAEDDEDCQQQERMDRLTSVHGSRLLLYYAWHEVQVTSVAQFILQAQACVTCTAKCLKYLRRSKT